jgi:hypothetical protein
MIRQQRRRIARELKSIKILSISEKLSASTGLSVLVEMFAKSPFMKEIEKFLPERVSNRRLHFEGLVGVHEVHESIY